MKSNTYALQFLQDERALPMTVPSFEIEIAEINKGSEKQIEWAKNIQREYFNEFCTFARNNESSLPTEKVIPMFNKAFSSTDAKFWIDNKGLGLTELIKATM